MDIGLDPALAREFDQLFNTDLAIIGSDTSYYSSPSSSSHATPVSSSNRSPVALSTESGGEPDKQFHCPECPLSFRRNHDLKRHVKIHLPVRPYTCELCFKAFNRKDALRRHVLSNACKIIKRGQIFQQQQQRWNPSTPAVPQKDEPSQRHPQYSSTSHYGQSDPTNVLNEDSFEKFLLDQGLDQFTDRSPSASSHRWPETPY